MNMVECICGRRVPREEAIDLDIHQLRRETLRCRECYEDMVRRDVRNSYTPSRLLQSGPRKKSDSTARFHGNSAHCIGDL